MTDYIGAAVPPHDRSPDCQFLLTAGGCVFCCNACNYDIHTCPGCGTHLSHLDKVCGDCNAPADDEKQPW